MDRIDCAMEVAGQLHGLGAFRPGASPGPWLRPVFTEDSRWPASVDIRLFSGQQVSQKSQLCSLDEG